MYKTGDMARYLPDGNLVFLGRNDHQVKIRGFRVELGEIEARLSSHSLVDKVVVVAVGQGGNKQLVGYVVAKPDEHLVHSLRSYLATCLPNYMIPAAFVRLDDMPLTSNGKVDRRRLPEPDMKSVAHQAYEATHGDVEDALLSIWRELLHIDRIGRHDNFFMLGGHSLLVTKMVHQIKTWMGFKITLNDLFAAPTIAELVPRLLAAGSTQEDSFEVLLPIKSQGSRLPLFCIHHGFGLCWTYISLLKYMHPDQPMYGLQMRGLFDNSRTAESVEEMALDYIDQIRRIQPRGPYSLLGYSFGGMVAHTMAAILERQGDKVALLGNMDSIPMVSEQEAMEIVQQQEEGNVRDVSKFIQLFANRVQQDGISDTERALVERVSQIVHRVIQLGLAHSSLCCQSGMILFRAMIHENPSVHPPISPDVWKPYVMGKIEVYDIDSDHQNMDQPAPSAEIGRVLSKRLDEIHAENMKNMKEE
ncbi:Alpha/Beta hydrolase protein [Mortierella sp. GBAus27b]|nr:Alpha/Beta hydrolase protein [Mortierella sp. GBAus27b]